MFKGRWPPRPPGRQSRGRSVRSPPRLQRSPAPLVRSAGARGGGGGDSGHPAGCRLRPRRSHRSPIVSLVGGCRAPSSGHLARRSISSLLRVARLGCGHAATIRRYRPRVPLSPLSTSRLDVVPLAAGNVDAYHAFGASRGLVGALPESCASAAGLAALWCASKPGRPVSAGDGWARHRCESGGCRAPARLIHPAASRSGGISPAAAGVTDMPPKGRRRCFRTPGRSGWKRLSPPSSR